MLVSTRWLGEHLFDPDLAVVDMRWREDGSGRARFERGHVPGATFLDWSTDLVDPDHPVAFMLAPPERFVAVMERCVLARVLRQTQGNQSQAAAMLGITRGSLRNKIRALGITIARSVQSDGDEPDL